MKRPPLRCTSVATCCQSPRVSVTKELPFGRAVEGFCPSVWRVKSMPLRQGPAELLIGRCLLFLVLTVAYGGIWLALAALCSVVFPQPATAALASIAVWLFFMVFWGIIAQMVARIAMPIQFGYIEEVLAQAELELTLSRLSPNALYSEAILAVLKPSVRSLGPVLPIQLQGAVFGAPLPLDQSVALIWPHLTGLIAATILLFAVGYVLFERREIRA